MMDENTMETANAKDKNVRVHELVNAGPLPGMSEAFDAHMGAACWTDPAYAPDASMWAAAWRAAKAQPVAVPQGWKLVPEVPTDAMVLAAFSSIPSEDADPDDPGTLAAWERMLAATPAAPAPWALGPNVK